MSFLVSECEKSQNLVYPDPPAATECSRIYAQEARTPRAGSQLVAGHRKGLSDEGAGEQL